MVLTEPELLKCYENAELHSDQSKMGHLHQLANTAAVTLLTPVQPPLLLAVLHLPPTHSLHLLLP